MPCNLSTNVPKGVPYKRCRDCGEPVEDRSMLTATGLHIACAERIQREATLQLIAHDGPYFDHWRRRCLAAFGVREDAEPSTGR